MIDEDTGEEPKCVFCHAVDECEHLVACIDRTFCECGGGAMHDRDWEFRSYVEDVFLTQLKSDSETQWADIDTQRLWDQAKLDYDSEKDELDLDLCILANLIIQLLQNSGAVDYPGPVRDEGGPPGFTSSYSLLYAENPGAVVDEALERLKLSLGHPRPKREEADKELIIID